MRPLEIVLSLANLLAFCILLIPRPDATRWMAHMPLVAVLAAGLQPLVEGPRWQMIPAYVLALVFLLVRLVGTALPVDVHVNRGVRGMSIGLGVPVLLVSIFLPIVLPVFRFPPPGGPYPIPRWWWTGWLGYDFLCIADHNFLTRPESVELPAAAGSGFIVIPSEEITGSVHMTAMRPTMRTRIRAHTLPGQRVRAEAG
jgi:hypothetical protein